MYCFGGQKIENTYFLDNNAIENVSFVCDLGLFFEPNLKFIMHCNYLVKRAYFCIRNLFNSFQGHTDSFYCDMYRMYVRPLLESACEVWSPENIYLIDKIEKVQKYFTRRLLRDENYGSRLQLLKLENLEERRFMADIKLFNKLLSDGRLSSICMVDFVIGRTRQTDNIIVQLCRTNVRKHYFSNRITKIYNHMLRNNNTQFLQFCRGIFS